MCCVNYFQRWQKEGLLFVSVMSGISFVSALFGTGFSTWIISAKCYERLRGPNPTGIFNIQEKETNLFSVADGGTIRSRGLVVVMINIDRISWKVGLLIISGLSHEMILGRTQGTVDRRKKYLSFVCVLREKVKLEGRGIFAQRFAVKSLEYQKGKDIITSEFGHCTFYPIKLKLVDVSLKDNLKELMEKGVVEASTSLYVSLLFLTPKKDTRKILNDLQIAQNR
ncbi:hypothetical protein PR048_012731 [Dryococelus australis]|uniref:Uncharacterized protein n=1 Tax=Dryococelus australis TaxID=614101 RepID=A0ABQ9HQG1_9NEOP|nr:hypothetical protein PR048_012731 [Dryococelus australis]